ncbi:MAG TPA: hypothetical protein VI233_07390 [Puia sp.]
MKSFLFLPLLALTGYLPGKVPSSFIDPTGTYRLKGVVKNNKVTGHSGELRVRLLTEHTVALCFYINAGYPGYRSGALLDTLSYEENKVEYRPLRDTACSVFFYFDFRKVSLLQVMSDPRSGCGWDPGVFAPMVFSKVSSEVPVIQSLEGHGG